MRSLCNNWEFIPEWKDGFATGEGEGQRIRLPHTVREQPLHYTDHTDYQMVCGYRSRFYCDPHWKGKRLFLQFDGAAHIATVYFNGKELATHACGYTAFRVEITGLIAPGEYGWIAVKLDTTENPNIPPFGYAVDYLTYGGLYREVWLDLREQAMIEDIYVATPTLTTACIRTTVRNAEGYTCQVELLEAGGRILLTETVPAGLPAILEYPEAKPWSPEDPQRYVCRVTLRRKDETMDVQEARFGFRTAEFKADGLYLNGKKYFMRGLNRHQSYPYIGYAATESLQREDARILKEELGCNAVRTSHYPQSQHFIDECDRLGLLVFTEIPGWQHIGDAKWQDQAVENVREMILQYRNHPSIILWGVRINESRDCDELYRRTNELAHQLDPSRATSGVRCILQSSLLEDVYAYNDFSHVGTNPGVRKKKTVTPDMKKGLLVSEHSGHVFPTKSFDHWAKRQEHALRHARVLNDAAADGEHAGCFGWCMFDYATHKDFGSGDRICYHGVLDSFRNPKLAAALYASQQDTSPVLEVSSPMAIGDYAGSDIGQVYVFTNADQVRLYKNDTFISTLSRGDWKGLPHGPMIVDDLIGDLLETQEGFSHKKSELVKKALMSASRYGLGAMPLGCKLQLAWCALRTGLTLQQGTDLYGKYISNWGDVATRWRFDAIRSGEVVASVTCAPSTKLQLEVTASHTRLRDLHTYDMASLRIRVLDEYGNIASYAQLPIQLTTDGNSVEVVGPNVITAEGGMTGTYLRSTGKRGITKVTISADGLESITLDFNA